MSTRAVYSFYDEYDTTQKWQEGGYHVYKHHDGYPEGAAGFLANALIGAWELPRFEADEFAASFVANNKIGAGGVRLANSQTYQADIEYVYEVFMAKNGQLIVKAFSVNFWNDIKIKDEFFYGRLKDFIIRYGDSQAKLVWDTYGPKSSHPTASLEDNPEYKEYMRLKQKYEFA